MREPGIEIEGQLEGTMQAEITCPHCGTKFSFQEGAKGPTSLGIREKIVMCPYCYNAYPAEVTPSGITLGEAITKKYASIANRQEQNRLVTCEVCQQLRKEGSFTCNRCGRVNWTGLIFLFTFGLVAAGMGLFGKHFVSLVGWVLGAIIIGTCVSELVKAIKTPKSYKIIHPAGD